MQLHGTPEKIIASIQSSIDVESVLERVQKRIPFLKRQIAPYQGASLYALALKYNTPNSHILEIGTAHGYSAAILAEACPNASIVTLNPNVEEAAIASENLAKYPNVEVVTEISWDYLKTYRGPKLDMIFVDGDHKRVRLDLPWWDWLKDGGLMLFHDYSPAGTYRECPPVYEAVNEFGLLIGKEPDVLIVDDGGVGLAGYFQEGRSVRQMKGETMFELSQCHAASVNSYAHIEALYHLAEEVRDLEGDIVECGVTNGGSAIAIYAGARKSKKQKRILWAYDTFSGMPKPGPEDGNKAQWKWEQYTEGWCLGHPGNVLALAKALKIPITAVNIVEGDFERTLSQHNDIAFLHVDATLYRSTKQALEALYGQVVSGGIVVVSAYGHWGGVRQAVEEFWVTLPTKPMHLLIEGVNVWWRK